MPKHLKMHRHVRNLNTALYRNNYDHKQALSSRSINYGAVTFESE